MALSERLAIVLINLLNNFTSTLTFQLGSGSGYSLPFYCVREHLTVGNV